MPDAAWRRAWDPCVILRLHADVACCGSQTSQTRGPERDSASRSNDRGLGAVRHRLRGANLSCPFAGGLRVAATSGCCL